RRGVNTSRNSPACALDCSRASLSAAALSALQPAIIGPPPCPSSVSNLASDTAARAVSAAAWCASGQAGARRRMSRGPARAAAVVSDGAVPRLAAASPQLFLDDGPGGAEGIARGRRGRVGGSVTQARFQLAHALTHLHHQLQ